MSNTSEQNSRSNQLNIRCPADLKTRFIKAAKENGTSASDLIIDFMQRYLGEAPVESLDADVKSLIDRRIDQRLAEIEERIGKRLGKSRRAA